jgi:hypothetical protein
MTETPRTPDLDAQRAAMKKLDFLRGSWVGEARVLRGPGQSVDLIQTEEAEYRLDGLVLVIEGVGRTKADGRAALQALGLVSYDDATESYRMRAFNDGRFLETEVKLLEHATGITWGFTLGQIQTSSVLQINDRGEWTEQAEITFGSQLPKKFLELTVRRR